MWAQITSLVVGVRAAEAMVYDLSMDRRRRHGFASWAFHGRRLADLGKRVAFVYAAHTCRNLRQSLRQLCAHGSTQRAR